MAVEVQKGPDRPLIPFAKPDIHESDIHAVTEVLRSGWITSGSVTQLLEGRLSDRLGVEHVVAVSSCTAAIEIALASQRLPEGSIVGVPTWTFVSTALAVIQCGHRPLLLDVDPDTLNLTATEVERAADLGARAVIPVHFGGVAVDAGVHAVAAARDLVVIEDAAHAFGAADERGLVAGQGSVAACYSFYATKNLTSAEGGALATTDAEVARFARSYRLHGMNMDAWSRYLPNGLTQYDVDMAGIKANMPDLLAALALSQLGRFDESQAQRGALVGRYRERLGRMGVDCVPREDPPGNAHHLMVIELPEHLDRAAVVDLLAERGIATSVHFAPLHLFTVARDSFLAPAGGFPVADRLAPRVLSLPLSAGMALEDVDRVCDAVESVL